MMTLGIVLLVSTLSGSYGLAGQVSGAYIIGNAVFAIPHGRLADRFGQGKVLCVDSVAFALTTGLMIVSIVQDWPLPWPHVLAALAGAAIPQIGTMVRARWAHLLPMASERHTAFAAESVADEVVFVTGPAIVTLLATSLAPQAGLLAALAVGTIGAAALAAQQRTEPPAHPRDKMTARDRMPWGLLVPLTAGAVALGSVFGALEVATVAFADDAGHKGYAGLMLGAFSLGSLLAGVVAGTIALAPRPAAAGPHRHGPARGGDPLAAVPVRPAGGHGRAVRHRPRARADPDHVVLPDRGVGAEVAAQRGDGRRPDRHERRHRAGRLDRRCRRRRGRWRDGVLGVLGVARARRAWPASSCGAPGRANLAPWRHGPTGRG